MATLNKQKRDTEFKPYHVQFAEQVISMLEQGTAPWQKPWKGGEVYAPHNEVNGNQYKGLNRIMLSYFSDMKYGGDPRYMTLVQANNQGYRVRKGEHSQSVVHWQFTEEHPVLDASGKPLVGEDGAPRKESVRLERPRVKYARVFNATQLERAEDGAPYPAFDPSRAPHFSWEPNVKAATILAGSGAVIEHRPGDRACYLPAQDTIVLPEREQFLDAAEYYGTALHELGHWTGHESRLDRDIRHPFGSAEYAREELRAEIASWMMSQDLGIAHEPGQHAAYVADWIQALRNDPYEIVRAAGKAEKIKEYVMGLEQTQILNSQSKERLEKNFNHLIRPELVTSYTNTVEQLYSHISNLSIDERRKLENRKKYLQEKSSEFSSEMKTGFINFEKLIKQINSLKKQVLKFSDQDNEWWDLNSQIDSMNTNKTIMELALRNNPIHFTDVELNNPQQLERTVRRPLPAMNPQEEFAQALKDAGLDLRGELPEMDGKLHRVPLADRPHGRDGAYVGYLDGRPAGYIQNFVTGEKMNWTASGHRLSEAQLTELRAEADQRRQQREAERQVEQNRVAKQCAEIFEQRPLAASNHPYLMRKGVLPHGLRESPDGSKLIVPLRNIQGDIRSVQIINEDGSKFFEKGGQKHGCFHLLGGEEKLKKQGQVLLAEGYATAASLYEATGRPVAACFDAGNLEPVAKALREKYPLLHITVCADNDVRNDVNVGMAKAERAAKAVKGRVAIPRFTPEEEARGMTDFNDLHQLRGEKAVKEAVLQARHQTRGMER